MYRKEFGLNAMLYVNTIYGIFYGRLVEETSVSIILESIEGNYTYLATSGIFSVSLSPPTSPIEDLENLLGRKL
jgi:hypothetical protein